MGDLLKKIVPNMVQEFAKNGAKAVSNAVTKIGLNPKTLLDKQLLANRINSAVVVGEVAHTTTQAAGNVSQGVFVKNASDAMANFSLAQVALEQIQKWLTQAVEHFSENQKVTEELIKTMSDSLQQNSEAGRFVLRQSRA